MMTFIMIVGALVQIALVIAVIGACLAWTAYVIWAVYLSGRQGRG